MPYPVKEKDKHGIYMNGKQNQTDIPRETYDGNHTETFLIK